MYDGGQIETPRIEFGDNGQLVLGPVGISAEAQRFIYENLPLGSYSSCKLHQCFQYLSYGREAESNAVNVAYPSASSADSNVVDAYRHVYWAYRLTDSLGPETALSLLNGHEFRNLIDGGSVDDTKMDLHNNNVGIYWGDIEMDPVNWTAG